MFLRLQKPCPLFTTNQIRPPNNIVLICKKHYIDYWKILGLDSSQVNPKYTATTLSKQEIIDNHMTVLSSFGLSMKVDLPLLYWIPTLHKCPYKQRYSTGAAKCSIKPLSNILTSILTAVNIINQNQIIEGKYTYCSINSMPRLP